LGSISPRFVETKYPLAPKCVAFVLPDHLVDAFIRSGYLANATPANPGTMTVNLSSDRVRLALSMLEGIRNGQNLGALLGYR
jgi:hypothetical protein